METTNFIINRLKRVPAFFWGFFLCIVTLYGCASQKPQLNVSQYRFNYNDQAYRIRSISLEDKKESYNEIIGQNFLAIDFDQDRVIDRILLGEVSLNEAQKIYEYGLDEVTRENKLYVRVSSNHRYVHENPDFHLEIRSFRPTNAHPFNEFKIVDSRQMVSPQTIVIVDKNADGTLDEVLKGTVALEEAQCRYTEAIEAGLRKGELAKVNGMILVKEK
jgi:hypothetical protein